MAWKKSEIAGKLIERLDKAKMLFQFEFMDRWNRRTPIRTGDLRAGNTVEVTDTSFTFDNEVEYFGYVEHGTPKMAPVGMLKTTLSEVDAIWEIANKRAKRTSI